MIWFACEQCGKRHQRPEEAAGTLVFCECGYGNRVPWESTPGPPAAPRTEPEPARPPPRPRPRQSPTLEELAPRHRRRPARQETYRRDPAFCFHHQDVPTEQTCAECGEGFCAACVTVLKGRTLCGPCKNFHARALDQPPSPSGLAITTLVLGIVSGPFALCLLPVAFHRVVLDPISVAFGLIGFLCQVGTLVLGFLALYKTETTPRLQGQSLAITGMVSALVAIIFVFTTFAFAALR
jgi:hypothetical protein